MDITRMAEEYREQFYAYCIYNFDEMGQYFERHKLSKHLQGKMF